MRVASCASSRSWSTLRDLLVAAAGVAVGLLAAFLTGLDSLAPAKVAPVLFAAATVFAIPSLTSRRRRGEPSRTAEREDDYRLLADYSSDLVLRLASDGRADFVSGAAGRMLGHLPGNLAGSGLLRVIHSDDRSRFLTALQRASRNGDAMTCFRMRHACGQDRWIEAQFRLAGHAASPVHVAQPVVCTAAAEGRCHTGPDTPCALFSRDSRPTCTVSGRTIVASLRDIHDRRTAELLAAESAERLRESNRLLMMAEELASLGHWVFYPETGRLTLSAEAAAMLDPVQGTATLSEALGWLGQRDRLRLLRTYAAARRAQAPTECTVRLDSGEGRTLQLRMQHLGEGAHASLFGVVSDITAKLHDQERLVSALEEARAAASFRSQFLATMSHEIRTPMTGVIGMIELLDTNPTAEERRLYLDTLRSSGELLMAVVNDILDFSKVDAGQITVADEPFDLGAALLTTLRLFERTATVRGLTLTLDGPDPGTLWLRGDVLRLRQVLSNLLSNAIKFSEDGEIVLRCVAQPVGGGRHRLRLSVSDQGIGIAPALRARLFEPFVQGEGRSADGGTGLGLAISRRLVAAMGGTMQVQSRQRHGSTFTVSLALADASPSAVPDHPVQPAPGGALDILLAEDNPVNQLLVTALCSRLGHQVTCAPDGERAVALARTRSFDLILMDMQMPRCDGITATRLIRAGGGASANAPVIALTADAASASQRPGFDDAGFDALLTKPINSAAFTRTLSSMARVGAGRLPLPVPPRAPVPEALDRATLDELRAVLGPARLDQLLLLLVEELDQRPSALRGALADRDFAAAAAHAHSLKGAAANLGASRVAEAARELERGIAAAAEGRSNELPGALRRLAADVEATRQALAARRSDARTALHGT